MLRSLVTFGEGSPHLSAVLLNFFGRNIYLHAFPQTPGVDEGRLRLRRPRHKLLFPVGDQLVDRFEKRVVTHNVILQHLPKDVLQDAAVLQVG